MILLKIKTQKQLFLQNRLLFDKAEKPADSGENNIDAAKAEALRKTSLEATVTELASSNSGTVDQIIAKASEKINATADINEATKTEAIRLLKANAESLNAAKKYISDRAAYKLTMDAQETTDFDNGMNLIKKAKPIVDSLKAYNAKDDLASAFDQIVIDYKQTAKERYDAQETIASRINEDTKFTSNETMQSWIPVVGQLQNSIYKGFPGLDEADAASRKTKFEGYITTILGALQANGADADPEAKRQLDMFNFARTNYEGASKGGKSEHLAGAKQYMEMVLSEQDARATWNQLSFNGDVNQGWRTNSIETEVPEDSTWSKTTGNREIYNEAVQLFLKAKAKSANNKVGDSSTATALFKQAGEKFTELLNKQTEEKNRTEKASTSKEDEKQLAGMTEYNTNLDNLSAAYKKIKSKAVFDHFKTITSTVLTTSKRQADSGEYALANIALLTLKKQIEGDIESFDKMAKALKDHLKAACDSMGTGGAYLDDTKAKILGDWNSDQRTVASYPAYMQAEAPKISFGGEFVYKGDLYYFNGKGNNFNVYENFNVTDEEKSSHAIKAGPGDAFYDRTTLPTYDVSSFKQKDPVAKKPANPDKKLNS